MIEHDFPIDFSSLITDTRPRRWLVLPEGYKSASPADMLSPEFNVDAKTLLDRFSDMALMQPRVTKLAEDGLQCAFVQKSAVFKFPDIITIQTISSQTGSHLCLYSRALKGHYDFRVNEKRIKAWLDLTTLSLQADGNSK